MKTKKIMGLIAIIVGISFPAYFLLVAKNNIDHFTNNKINLKIIRIYNYYDKSLQFYYDENYCITTTDTRGDTLFIGDSIAKEKNTVKFKVFRKNKLGKYEYFNEYQISGI
jgi:hypothetical protein